MSDSLAAQREVNRHFSNSANTYRCGATLQQKVGESIIKRVRRENINYGLDLGCGPGLFAKELGQITQRLVSLDLSHTMLRNNAYAGIPVQGDSHQLPLQSSSFDLVFSSLMLQWCDPEKVLDEVYRILKPGGQAVISTLTTGTLFELQSAWASVDDDQHIHQYLGESELGRLVANQPWHSTQLQSETICLQFKQVKDLAKELKQLGANYVKGRKNKGLMTKNKWLTMESAYREKYKQNNGKIPATYQVMYFVLEK